MDAQVTHLVLRVPAAPLPFTIVVGIFLSVEIPANLQGTRSYTKLLKSMATPKSTRHRFALGPGNVNIFASCLIPAKHYDSDGGDKIVRKDHNTLPRKRSIDCSDDVQKSKVARYFGVPDKRVGIEHWLEDGVVSGSPSCLREGDTRAFCQTVSAQLERKGSDGI